MYTQHAQPNIEVVVTILTVAMSGMLAEWDAALELEDRIRSTFGLPRDEDERETVFTRVEHLRGTRKQFIRHVQDNELREAVELFQSMFHPFNKE